MRFYGGDPAQWMTRTPRRWVRACLRMIPRLVSEEAIQRVNEVGVGTGSLGDAGPRIAQRWIDQVVPTQPATGKPAGAPTPDKLAAMGFGVA